MLSLLALSASTEAAAPSPDGERIAFSFIAGPESIWVADVDGSSPEPVVSVIVAEVTEPGIRLKAMSPQPNSSSPDRMVASTTARRSNWQIGSARSSFRKYKE